MNKDDMGFVSRDPNLNYESGCTSSIRWLSKENISVIDSEGNKIENVTCCVCNKDVDTRECTYLMSRSTHAWICQNCHFGDSNK